MANPYLTLSRDQRLALEAELALSCPMSFEPCPEPPADRLVATVYGFDIQAEINEYLEYGFVDDVDHS